MSAAQKSHEAVTPFVMGAVSSLLLYTRASPLLARVQPLENSHQDALTSLQSKELLLHLDSNFGGLPFSNPLEFLYRGHPDPLTSCTTYLHLLLKEIGALISVDSVDRYQCSDLTPEVNPIQTRHSLPIETGVTSLRAHATFITTEAAIIGEIIGRITADNRNNSAMIITISVKEVDASAQISGWKIFAYARANRASKFYKMI